MQGHWAPQRQGRLKTWPLQNIREPKVLAARLTLRAWAIHRHMEKKMNAISLRGFWPRARKTISSRSEAAKPAAADLQPGEAAQGELDEASSPILGLAENNPHIIAATLLFSKKPK